LSTSVFSHHLDSRKKLHDNGTKLGPFTNTSFYLTSPVLRSPARGYRKGNGASESKRIVAVWREPALQANHFLRTNFNIFKAVCDTFR
jgi:hypothetical protein